jgi:hypothetical protein
MEELREGGPTASSQGAEMKSRISSIPESNAVERYVRAVLSFGIRRFHAKEMGGDIQVGGNEVRPVGTPWKFGLEQCRVRG